MMRMSGGKRKIGIEETASTRDINHPCITDCSRDEQNSRAFEYLARYNIILLIIIIFLV